MFPFRLCLQKYRNYPGSGSEIQGFLTRPYISKAGQQNGIHSKAEAVLFLDNPVTVSMQFIDSLVFL